MRVLYHNSPVFPAGLILLAIGLAFFLVQQRRADEFILTRLSALDVSQNTRARDQAAAYTDARDRLGKVAGQVDELVQATKSVGDSIAELDGRLGGDSGSPNTSQAASQQKAIIDQLLKQQQNESAALRLLNDTAASLKTLVNENAQPSESDDGHIQEVQRSDSAKPDTCSAVIDAIPYTISRSGIYCLDRSIDSSASELDAIRIAADNVVLDGRGYFMSGPSVPSTKTRGILAVDQHGLTIRNIRIEGFSVGILVGDTTPQISGTTAYPSARKSRDILVDDVRIDNSSFRGIYMSADNFTIKNSTVAGIGPSSVNPHSFATGIIARGNICTISNNRVSLGDPTDNGENIGIGVNLGSGCLIADNVIYFDKYPVWGRNYGIWTKSEGGALPEVTRNLVAGANYAYGPHGIFIDNVSENASCALFAKRPSPVDLLVDLRGNANFESHGFVRPGLPSCPDNPEQAKQRFMAARSDKAAYAVALAYAEVSAVESQPETLAWLLVATDLGHTIARTTAANPAASGYDQATIQKAEVMAVQIEAAAGIKKEPSVKVGG